MLIDSAQQAAYHENKHFILGEQPKSFAKIYSLNNFLTVQQIFVSNIPTYSVWQV
jgi:hypothetical protein